MNGQLNILWEIFGNLLIVILLIYCWYRCVNRTINLSDYKIYVVLAEVTVMSVVFNYTVIKPIRMILVFTLLVFSCHYLLREKFKISLLVTIVSEILLWLVEFTFTIGALLVVGDDIENFMTSVIGYLSVNLYIVFISFSLLKLGVPEKIYSVMYTSSKSIKNKETFVYMLLLLLMILVSTVESYMNLPLYIVLTTNVIVACIFMFIIIMFARTKANYYTINSKYQTSISSLREHEFIVDKLRINSHENKNELMTIRNMSKDKMVVDYIDKLIDNKIKDNETIMNKTSKIPEGGLRATIYSKMCIMDKEKISYKLIVAKDVKTVDLINMDDELVVNICRVLGVLLDNAIEATLNIANKFVQIELYLIDQYLYIEVTNNYEGKLDLDSMSNKKYTSKGKNHGYGLLLVNQIVNGSNGNLQNEKRIDGDRFTQILKIKM